MLVDGTALVVSMPVVGLRGGSRGGSGGTEYVLLFLSANNCTGSASFPFHAGGNDRTLFTELMLLSEVLLVLLAGSFGGGALDAEGGAFVSGGGAVNVRLTAAGGWEGGGGGGDVFCLAAAGGCAGGGGGGDLFRPAAAGVCDGGGGRTALSPRPGTGGGGGLSLFVGKAVVRITVGRSFIRLSFSSSACDGRRGVDGLGPIGDQGTSLMKRVGVCVRGAGCEFAASFCSVWSFSLARRAAIPPPEEVSISDIWKL